MDPQACLARLIEAIRDNDLEEMQTYAGILAAWMDRKGCIPNVSPWQFTILIHALAELDRFGRTIA